MIGRILFAARFGTQLDYDCKKWRLFADVLNDLAMLIEILTPKFGKEYTLPVLCCASVSRSLVGVAGGATKAAVAQHQAKSGNMADLNAKDGSQETMVNLIALLINLTMLPWLSSYPGLVFPIFLLMTCLHIFANYKAVTSLEFSTLNQGRLNSILECYENTGQILSIPEGNIKEKLRFSFRNRIRLGASLHHFTSLLGFDSILAQDPRTVSIKVKGTSFILLNEKALPRDVIKVYIEAWMSIFSQDKQKENDSKKILEKLEEVGWSVNQRALQTEGYTFKFKQHLHEE